MRLPTLTITAVAVILALAASLHPGQAQTSGTIEVQAAMLMRDGRPWVPKGVTVVGRTVPAAAVRGPFREARGRFGADTIRFQVSQPGIDHESPVFRIEECAGRCYQHCS